MLPAFSPELQQLINERMATGLYSSEQDVILAGLQALSDCHATIADIRQGVIDYKNGGGQPLSDAIADIRKELGVKQ